VSRDAKSACKNDGVARRCRRPEADHDGRAIACGAAAMRLQSKDEGSVNPAVGPIPATRIEVRLERDVALAGRVWPAPAPRALIAIAHGIGEHSGRYAALAGELVRARYTVAALDWPGHGESGGSRGDARSWIHLRDHFVSAMFTATRGLPGQPDQLPHVLLGHSMGGVLALDFALAHPRDLIGVVASAPGLRSAMPPWWKLVLANIALATAPSMGFPTGIEEGGISRDSEVIRARDEDALVHDRISPRLYHGFTEARQRVLREARRLAVPTLVLYGSADRVVDPEGAREFCESAPRGMLHQIVYPDAYHEVFNDHVRDQAIRDLLAWLDQRCPK
jgi:alpha-beta hydrolase superfamily lysophospholipase